jgi:hypothetical protein
MSHNHFTLGFPIKSPADSKAVAEQLQPLIPQLIALATRRNMQAEKRD